MKALQMMTVSGQICAAIYRNPKINRVIVCQREYEQIQAEFKAMALVPWNSLWDDDMKRAEIKILGRLVSTA